MALQFIVDVSEKVFEIVYQLTEEWENKAQWNKISHGLHIPIKAYIWPVKAILLSSDHQKLHSCPLGERNIILESSKS